MVLNLFGVSFLLFGSTLNITKSIFNIHNDSGNNNHVEKLDLPKQSAIFNGLTGNYNFYNSYDFSELETGFSVDFNIQFDEDHTFNCPLSTGQKLYFIESCYIDVSANRPSTPRADVTFYCYDPNDPSDTYTFTINDIYDETDISDSSTEIYQYRDLFFNINNTIYLTDDEYLAFNLVFTKDDNLYVTSYNGYYNFLNNGYVPLNGESLDIFGYTIFNNRVVFAMSGYAYQHSYLNRWDIVTFDTAQQHNVISTVNYPFKSDQVSANNIYFNGVKMSVETYDLMTDIGVFAYVRDDSQYEGTFQDLLFSIMDSGVYMLSRLLNFELFGMNLFVALSGLLTLAIVVVVIRKIW